MEQHSKYIRLELLDQGTITKVYLCEYNHKLFALKQVNLKGLCSEQVRNLKQEAAIMAQLNHPCIIKLTEVFEANKNLYIVTPFAAHGSLYEYIKQEKNITEETILGWLCQICLGLRYLHKNGVVHRDIKTQNIFLNSKKRCIIGDFGVSKKGKTVMESFVGTPYYLPPELILKMPYGSSCDMWSLGVVMFEVCERKVPFSGEDLQTISQNILSGSYPKITQKFSKGLRDVIEGMMCSNPALRMTADDVISSKICREYLKKYDK